MTGRDLIIYILQNRLEDEKVFKDGKFMGLITVQEAAVKFGVGESTVLTWFFLGQVQGVKIGSEVFIFPHEENPIERSANK